MTTREIKQNLELKLQTKTLQELEAILENNQNRLQSGSDLEEGLIINDVVTEAINKLKTKI
ncbi:MAG: hypothetical protein MUF43_11940 [Flavobacterium sp.]|jgi:hypothetical protein|nr:hypothetical protein [Flavobacterium sp.]